MILLIGFRQKKKSLCEKEFASGKLLYKNQPQFVISYIAIQNMELNLKAVGIKDFFTSQMNRSFHFLYVGKTPSLDKI